MIREYYVISIVIIIAAILWFMWSFERRKPQEREVVMLAVMTAMAVVGRAIFIVTPQFKPCAAIIIITGIMFGKQSGFLCGVLTAFVSNFIFGQGPWTPWQMIAFGLVGLVSAIIFNGKREYYADNRILLGIYGFLITFLLYGFIMDTSTVLTYTDKLRSSTFMATYLSGLYFNIIHGLSTLIFLLILSKSIFSKIRRLKVKYGMFN